MILKEFYDFAKVYEPLTEIVSSAIILNLCFYGHDLKKCRLRLFLIVESVVVATAGWSSVAELGGCVHAPQQA